MRAVIPLVFFALATWFLVGARGAPPSLREPVILAEGALARGPLRTPMEDPPSVVIGGFSQTCVACHRLFESQPIEGRTLQQHTHIALNHGLNDSCYNCHSLGDRNKLVLFDGTEIAYGEVVELCARCHGTTFRDWEGGMHGKTMGSWDASSGQQRRLTCTQCHDPHSPAFDPFEPLPGPRTLRMGPPVRSHSQSAKQSPLQRWSRGTQHDEDQ